MGMRDNINAEWGVLKFIGEKGMIKTGRRGEVNKLLTEFLVENSLPVQRHNPRYRGFYDAVNKNCQTVQDNWSKFHTWCNNKIKEDGKISD